jgi:hypothetical protein
VTFTLFYPSTTEAVLHNAVNGPLLPCGSLCDDIVCRCPEASGPVCEHDTYAFLDDGTKYCVECYDELDEDDEEDE